MTRHDPTNDGRGEESLRLTDELLDAYFDRALDERSQERVLEALEREPARRREAAEMHELLLELRRLPDAPDVTAAVLRRVGRRRLFLPASWRRAVTAGRVAAAACVSLALLCVAMAHRYAPEMMRLGPQPRAISSVVDAGTAGASTGVREVARTVAEVGALSQSVCQIGDRVLLTIQAPPPAPPVTQRTVPMAGALRLDRAPEPGLRWAAGPTPVLEGLGGVVFTQGVSEAVVSPRGVAAWRPTVAQGREMELALAQAPGQRAVTGVGLGSPSRIVIYTLRWPEEIERPSAAGPVSKALP